MALNYSYVPGQMRRKHKWTRDKADFDPPNVPGSPGKCPSSITNTPGLAERLLQEGIPWPPTAEHPERVYNVHQGVVYRAVPTIAGKSFHGFPEKEQSGRRVPEEVLEDLAARADKAGEFKKFKEWASTYLPQGWNALNYRPNSA
ncbi:MAG: hypothetical protein HQL84_07360 [Magnetococcales bacterium]|nr:hypothetical protein [Magnetococcales bacterium]MBF0149848.1 hypothetical protein [Magnetococcales bacterium]